MRPSARASRPSGSTGLAYPAARLREAWTRVLWHHFHDDITGTSIPQAYQFSWNDEFVSLNQFAGVLTSATSSVSSLLDTQAAGDSARRLQPDGDQPRAIPSKRRSTLPGARRRAAAVRARRRSRRPDAKFPRRFSERSGRRRDSVSRRRAVRRLQGVRRATRMPATSDAGTGFASPRSSLENAATASTSTPTATSRRSSTTRRSASCSSLRFGSRCATTRRRTSRRGGFSTTPSPRPVREYPSKPVSPHRRARSRSRRARDHAPGGRIHDRPARHADGRRRSRRRRERHRLEVDEHAAQGGVPVRRVQPEGDVRPRPRARFSAATTRRRVRGARAVVGRPHRHERRRSAPRCSTTASTAGTSRPTTSCD